ncbi:MAG: hypothetical protein LBF72_04145 [Holosporales bacterium]|jgi:hypothetical protein|nr:hypothetical protein [Holosporales bacterium]
MRTRNVVTTTKIVGVFGAIGVLLCRGCFGAPSAPYATGNLPPETEQLTRGDTSTFNEKADQFRSEEPATPMSAWNIFCEGVKNYPYLGGMVIVTATMCLVVAIGTVYKKLTSSGHVA